VRAAAGQRGIDLQRARRVLLHVIAETARPAGHADIIRGSFTIGSCFVSAQSGWTDDGADGDDDG